MRAQPPGGPQGSSFETRAPLQIGPYKVDVEASRFEQFESIGITLTANADLEINGKPKVWTAAKTVTVDASSMQVETAGTQLEQTINDSAIEGLPLNDPQIAILRTEPS